MDYLSEFGSGIILGLIFMAGSIGKTLSAFKEEINKIKK
jgi:hypothetical protein